MRHGQSARRIGHSDKKSVCVSESPTSGLLICPTQSGGNRERDLDPECKRLGSDWELKIMSRKPRATWSHAIDAKLVGVFLAVFPLPPCAVLNSIPLTYLQPYSDVSHKLTICNPSFPVFPRVGDSISSSRCSMCPLSEVSTSVGTR